MRLDTETEERILRATEALTSAIAEADDDGWTGKSSDLVHYAEDEVKNVLLTLAGTILAERRKEAGRPKIIVDDHGLLTCPSCGGHSFKENGSHPCDWGFDHQDPEKKVLVLDGSFEWYDGEDEGYECEDCGLDFKDLPEGWDTEYA